MADLIWNDPIGSDSNSIMELKEQGVVEGLLYSECARGWIHNLCIQHKKYRQSIRLTLDTRWMVDAVKTSHFPIPTPQELRHKFAG